MFIQLLIQYWAPISGVALLALVYFLWPYRPISEKKYFQKQLDEGLTFEEVQKTIRSTNKAEQKKVLKAYDALERRWRWGKKRPLI